MPGTLSGPYIDLGQTNRPGRLHSNFCATSIHCMNLSRLPRRIVATIASMALLLSLTAAAAHACILSAAGPQNIVTSAPCPESAVEISISAEPDCLQEHFLSQQATPAAAEFAVLASVELPMIVAHLDSPFFAECATAALTSVSAHPYSPPLHTLYCRLRN